MEGIVDKATLSVIDLTKIGTLLKAYEDFGDEVLMAACVDPSFINQFAQQGQQFRIRIPGVILDKGPVTFQDASVRPQENLPLPPGVHVHVTGSVQVWFLFHLDDLQLFKQLGISRMPH